VLQQPPAPEVLAQLLAALVDAELPGQQLLELVSQLALQRCRPELRLLQQLLDATSAELQRMEPALLVSLAWAFAELQVGGWVGAGLWWAWLADE
jgi:hypothetical protein